MLDKILWEIQIAKLQTVENAQNVEEIADIGMEMIWNGYHVQNVENAVNVEEMVHTGMAMIWSGYPVQNVKNN